MSARAATDAQFGCSGEGVDARGNSSGNGRDDRIPPDQDSPRLARGRASSRAGQSGGDPTMMAVPVGPGSEMIGGESSSGGELDGTDTFRGWSEAAPPAGAPERCKFLRSIGPDGKLFDPRQDAVPTHRCAAFGDPLPLSLRQQELVCLQRVHVSCPRYMRGTLLAEESANATVVATDHAGPPYLIIAGLLFMTIAGFVFIGAMMGFLPGLTGAPAPSSSPSSIAVVGSPSASPSETDTPTPTIEPTPTPTAGPTATATATSSPTPTPTASPTPKPTPVPSATWPPGATASRMNLLVPCTGQANCWVYTVRSGKQNGSGVNDTLAGIVRFFGVDINTVYTLNSWAHSGIHPGDKLKIPAPTR
jgi:cell division septation protein DedD